MAGEAKNPGETPKSTGEKSFGSLPEAQQEELTRTAADVAVTFSEVLAARKAAEENTADADKQAAKTAAETKFADAHKELHDKYPDHKEAVDYAVGKAAEALKI